MYAALQLEYEKMTTIVQEHQVCESVPVMPLLYIQELPSFVGNDYYCESGCPGSVDLTTQKTFFGMDNNARSS